MIEVHELHKDFKLSVAKTGAFSGIRTLFSRDYRIRQAVHNISFSIQPGEFIGYIGPNGAGKSTTIKMLSGILHPTSGEVRIQGTSPGQHRRQVAAQLGVVFGQRSQLWWDLPVQDSYDILAQMYSVTPQQLRQRIGTLNDLLGLEEFWKTPVRKLSLGQRMRADVAASLIHDPDILFLDEPTIGLDIAAKRSIRVLLRSLNQEMGKTILLTTHDMDDIEQLCNRVMVINQGELTYDGTVQQLRERIGLPTLVRVIFQGPFQLPINLSTTLLPFDIPVKDLGFIRILEVDDRSVLVEANRQEIKAMDMLRELSTWGEVDDIHMNEPLFEDIIHTIY
ncbi:ABC transporter ATP-binding protein [Paenibacillus shirakamiensis]|uniref:ABC transporter ATP-binding protein n=1 Tax=Paenibacillus shirakamiensis TaxID=1265935 RepID=UPI001AE8E149